MNSSPPIASNRPASEFEELIDFIEEAQLDRVGCFQYSPVDGAAANELPDPVAPEVAEERWHRFMTVQAEISKGRLAQKVGKTCLLYTSPSPRDATLSRMPSSA